MRPGPTVGLRFVALFPDADQFGRTDTGLREALEWIGEQLHRREDLYGASVAALLHRHLYHDNSAGLLSGVLWHLAEHLNEKPICLLASIISPNYSKPRLNR